MGSPRRRNTSSSCRRGRTADGGATVQDLCLVVLGPGIARGARLFGNGRADRHRAARIFACFIPASAVKVSHHRDGGRRFGIAPEAVPWRSIRRMRRACLSESPTVSSLERCTGSFAEGFTGGVGTLGLAADVSIEVKTDELGFRSWISCPLEGAVRPAWSSPTFVLNNPIDPAALVGRVTVEPKVDGFSTDVSGSIAIRAAPKADGPARARAGRPMEAVDRLSRDVGRPGGGYPWPGSWTVQVPFFPHGQASRPVEAYSESGMLAGHLPRLYPVAGGEYERVGGCRAVRDADGGSDRRRRGLPVNPVPVPLCSTASLDKATIVDVDIDKLAGKPLANGFYRLGLRYPQRDGRDSQSRDLVILDTALTFKAGFEGRALVGHRPQDGPAGGGTRRERPDPPRSIRPDPCQDRPGWRRRARAAGWYADDGDGSLSRRVPDAWAT